jgi:hypothetical protein
MTTTFNPCDFVLRDDLDFARVDGLCRELLLTLYHNLVASDLLANQATQYASSADYFVRDFLVDNRLVSPFAVTPDLIRQFAATWYILNTVEPNLTEIAGHLAGIDAFCRYLGNHGYLPAAALPAIENECANTAYVGSRIDAFWNLPKDGYLAWEAECTLK